MNGYQLPAGASEGERFLIARVIEGRAEPEEITRWIESHMRKAEP